MRKQDKTALAVVVLGFAFARSRAARSTPATPPGRKPPAVPPGTPKGLPGAAPGPDPIPRVNTGGPTWARDRIEQLASAGITGDEALAILAQWAFETDQGKGEWNFNVGNIKPVGSQPRVNLGSAGMFRAFDSLSDGVRAYLSLVQSAHYKDAWAALQADPTSDEWVRALGRAQYYEGSQDAYALGWRHHRGLLAPLFVHQPAP